jgi:hypothetical protein
MAEMEGPKKGDGTEQDLAELTNPGQPDRQPAGDPSREDQSSSPWTLISRAVYLPRNAASGSTFESLSEQRRELYCKVLEQTDNLKDDPNAGPFLVRERLVAWLGLLAELAPEGEAGKIIREDSQFSTYLRGALEDKTRLQKACERMAESSPSESDQHFINSVYQAMHALVCRYEDTQNESDFTNKISKSLPDCIDRNNLEAYVHNLRNLGCDRAKGWYVDSDGERHELFCYDRMKDDVRVGMRSSGKAITGLIAVRLLDEYRKVRATKKTLTELVDTPFLELCPKFKGQVESKHQGDQESIKNWETITFRQLISHTSGLSNTPEQEADKLYAHLISLKPGVSKDPGGYCNPGFDVVNLALEEII